MRRLAYSDLSVAFPILSVVRNFSLHRLLITELERLFTRTQQGYKCLLCGKIIAETELACTCMIIHLFQEHPDKYYRIESMILEHARRQASRVSKHKVARVVHYAQLLLLNCSMHRALCRLFTMSRRVVQRCLAHYLSGR